MKIGRAGLVVRKRFIEHLGGFNLVYEGWLSIGNYGVFSDGNASLLRLVEVARRNPGCGVRKSISQL